MKTIAFYITDSGYGHLTRSLALIEQILETSAYDIYVACGPDQNEYAKVCLTAYEGRVHYSDVDTDANSAFMLDSFQVDVEQTKENIEVYLKDLNEHVQDEIRFLRMKEVELIITDISLLGILVGKAMDIRTIGISNYTWYNRFKNLGIEESVISKYKEVYNQLDYLYTYAYSDDMTGIECPKEAVGFVSRKVNSLSSGNLKQKYWPAVYFSIGQVANKGTLQVDFQNGVLFATGNLSVSGNVHVIKLPPRVAHTQDYIAASSLAIIKGGWSSVAECLVNKIPFGVVETQKGEDTELTNRLVEDGYAFLTNEEEIKDFNIKDFNIKAIKTKKSEFENDVKDIVDKIMSHITLKL